jgi:hypothetical protein
MNAEAQALLPSDQYSPDGQPGTNSNLSDQVPKSMSRSQRNIREWKTYLPENCVATMIAMGWDVST